MTGRRLPALVLVAAGSAAGAFAWRLRRRGRREHVDLYFADGSMVSFPPGSDEGDRLLPLARRVLAVGQE